MILQDNNTDTSNGLSREVTFCVKIVWYNLQGHLWSIIIDLYSVSA